MQMCLHVLPDEYLELFPKSHVIYTTWATYRTNQIHADWDQAMETCCIWSVTEITQAGKQFHVTYEINKQTAHLQSTCLLTESSAPTQN